MTIKLVIRLKNDLVMSFDAGGEQLAAYQGRYEEVKQKILRDATPDTEFVHWSDEAINAGTVAREDW